MPTRTDRRSRSGAHTPCHHCGKKLRHEKAVATHIRDVHPEPLSSPRRGEGGASAPGEGSLDANHPYGIEHPLAGPLHTPIGDEDSVAIITRAADHG